MNVDIIPASTIFGWEIAAPPRGLLEETTLLVEEAAFGIDPLFSFEAICLILSGSITNSVYSNTSIAGPERRTFRYAVGPNEQPFLDFTRLLNQSDPDGPITNRSNYARFLRALIDLGGPDLIPNFDKRRATSFVGLTLKLKRTEFPISSTSNLMGQIYLPTEIVTKG